LQYESHRKLKDYVRDLNRLLRSEPALYERQFKQDGFEWVDLNHRQESVIVYKRKGKDPDEELLVILNMTPVVRHDHRIGVPLPGEWEEIFNSDAEAYGGSDVRNAGPLASESFGWQGQSASVRLVLPPLATIVLAPRR
jgi:1,4-alpha-glucan branching enzyme